MPLIPALGRQRQTDLWVWGQPGLQSEFQNSQNFIEKPCFKKILNTHTWSPQIGSSWWTKVWIPSKVQFGEAMSFIRASYRNTDEGYRSRNDSKTKSCAGRGGTRLWSKGRWISEFEASLVYRVSSRTARAIQKNPVSKNQRKQKQTNKQKPN